jgi:hypothetical protein
VEKALDLVTLRIHCMRRTWCYAFTPVSRMLIFASVMMGLARQEMFPWTI